MTANCNLYRGSRYLQHNGASRRDIHHILWGSVLLLTKYIIVKYYEKLTPPCSSYGKGIYICESYLIWKLRIYVVYWKTDNMAGKTTRCVFRFVLISAIRNVAIAYITMYTNRPLNGFYCPGGSINNISGIEQQQCTHRCLIRHACKVMNYNPNDRVCVLGEHTCHVADSHPDYMLMVFRPQFSVECAIWKPKSNPLPSRTVDTHIGMHEALSRKQIGTDVLIGHATPSGPSYTVVNGKAEGYWGSYVLTVSSSCTLAWVPYTAGFPLPEKALVCGHLTSSGPTYCARVRRPDIGRMFYGYYPSGHNVAFYAYLGVQESLEMDILTQV